MYMLAYIHARHYSQEDMCIIGKEERYVD